jgi:4,5-dihydroxyphthalate decarboxylase
VSDSSYSVALELYDRHVPLFLGTVPPPVGYRLDYLEVGVTKPGRDGTNRHQRMLQGAFDIAEMSLAAFIIARSEGSAMTGVPVFPRRLFSQNHIYVNTASGVERPEDLAGKRVAIRAFQVTMSVLARGDLAHVHGVPLDSITWVTQRPDFLAHDRSGLRIEAAPQGRAIADMLLDGEVDALIDPGAPLSVLAEKQRVRPLFADRRAASVVHFRHRGYIPLMHILALRPGLVKEQPGLPAYLVQAWEAAKRQTREHLEDYAFPLAPLGRLAYEDDEALFGADPWPSGYAANARALDDFVLYLHDQGLIRRRLAAEELFTPDLLAT